MVVFPELADVPVMLVNGAESILPALKLSDLTKKVVDDDSLEP